MRTGQTANTDRYSPIEKGTIRVGRHDSLHDGLRDSLQAPSGLRKGMEGKVRLGQVRLGLV